MRRISNLLLLALKGCPVIAIELAVIHLQVQRFAKVLSEEFLLSREEAAVLQDTVECVSLA